MPRQIFISHSSEDKELLDELTTPFARSGVKQFIAGFEDLDEPVNEDLQDEIRRSRAMFVVLGPKAKAREHTKLWIAWEVGIAIQANKDVWVLEDVNEPVHMPIPNLTDYLLWDSKDNTQKRELRDLIETEFEHGHQDHVIETRLEPTKDGQRNVAIEGNSELNPTPREARCPYEDCGGVFQLRFRGISQFNCPVCRRAVDPIFVV